MEPTGSSASSSPAEGSTENGDVGSSGSGTMDEGASQVPVVAIASGSRGPRPEPARMSGVDSSLLKTSIGSNQHACQEDDEVEDKVVEFAQQEATIYDFQVLDCYQELYDLSQHRGMPLLIVNVASKCSKYSEAGYRLLCTLYERYNEHGFTVLAFPCTQFGNTEPFNAEDIETEVPNLYPNSVKSIDFPIMCQVDVNGEGEIPLYGYLKSCLKGGVGQTAINWNFTYFLIDRRGIPILRMGPETNIEEIEKPLRELLGMKEEE